VREIREKSDPPRCEKSSRRNPLPSRKLTQIAVERLSPPPAGSVTYNDSVLPGFGLRISARGRRTWVARYRVAGGKEIMETLGTAATIPNVGHARGLARASMLKARSGINPVEQRRADAATATKKPFTFADLAAEYLTKRAEPNTRPSTAYETRRILNRVLPHWAGRPARVDHQSRCPCAARRDPQQAAAQTRRRQGRIGRRSNCGPAVPAHLLSLGCGHGSDRVRSDRGRSQTRESCGARTRTR
jgi:hypothetical protein